MIALRRPRRRRVVVGIFVGAFVVAGIAGARAGFFARDRARPASVQDALRRFREGDRRARSLEGVYTFTTTGHEALDVLGGARHRYPAATTLTALRVPCGLRLDWRALQDRGTTWTLCSTAAGMELRTSSERHRFFWQTDTTTYACTGVVLVPSAQGDGGSTTDPRPFRCTTDKGAEQGLAHSLGREQVSVGGVAVTAEHVRTVATVSGANRGTVSADWWLDTRTALPVRIVLGSRSSRRTIVGTAHYSEDADLRLASLTPRR